MRRKVLLLPSLHRTNQGTEELNSCPGSHSKKGGQNSKPDGLAPGSIYFLCVAFVFHKAHLIMFSHLLLLIAPGDIKVL